MRMSFLKNPSIQVSTSVVPVPALRIYDILQIYVHTCVQYEIGRYHVSHFIEDTVFKSISLCSKTSFMNTNK